MPGGKDRSENGESATARNLSSKPWDLNDDAAYLALTTRDARFDGRLFVGVTSTGIYCRPVCRVRTPLRRNCRFFANAASAEQQGFRPCLRCRPELAPGLSLVDSSQALADAGRTDDRTGGPAGQRCLPAADCAAPRRHRPAPAPHLPASAWRDADRLSQHAAPAAGQATAHRHRHAGHAGGAGQRPRQPAALQRRLRAALPHEPEHAAPRSRAAPAAGSRARAHCGWPTGRPTTSTACSASWRSAACRAWRRSMARQYGARWPGRTMASSCRVGWSVASCRSAMSCTSRLRRR